MEKNAQNQINPDYTGIDNLEVMKSAVRYNAFLKNEILKSAPKSKGLWVDFGAGAGTFAQALRESNYPVTCIEMDPTLKKALTTNGFPTFSNLSEVNQASVDFIYSLNVLEHIEDDQKVLAELNRVLKPNQKAFIYVPAMTCLFTAMDEKVGHVRRYERRELIEKAKLAGFKIESCTFCDSIGFFATLAFKYLGNKNGNLNPRAIIIYDRFIFPISLIFDRFFGYWFGKNLKMTVKKTKESSHHR